MSILSRTARESSRALRLAQLLLVLTCALLLAACGGDADSASAERSGDAGALVAPTSERGSVAGVVVSSGREDQTGITVSLHGSAGEGRGTTLTDAQGRYFFGELAAGSYLISATLTGFKGAKSEAFAVKNAKTTPAPTLTLQAIVGNVTGKVRLQGRTDHAGALVRVADSTLQSVTDAEGKFALAEVPAGAHVLRISAAGYRERSSDSFGVDADPVDVGTLVLEEARGNLVGSATRVGDRDHSGILVTLEGTSYSVVTGPTGAYLLRDIPVGQYAVVASYPDYQDAHASDQEVQADGMTAVPSLALATNPGSIRGVVTLGGGSDHSGTLVTLVGTGLSAQTDAAGAFSIAGVRAGLHSVTASHDAHEAASAPVFTVVAGQEATLTPFALSRSQGAIGGKVVLAGRTDFGGVLVELSGTSHAVTTTSSGAFFFADVDTAVYEVRARAAGYTDALSQGVLVQRNQSTDLGTLTLAANPGSVVGSAFKDGAANHSGILVSVVGTGLSAVTASNGAYSIAAVPAGLHSVTATLVGYDAQSSAVFSVAAGAQSSLSALTLRASRGGLTGAVSLAGQSDHGSVLIEVVGTAFSTTSNSAGAYTLQNVPVGTYEVRASRAGYVSASAAAVTVSANVTTTVGTLTLAANPGSVVGNAFKDGAANHSGILVSVVGTGLSAVTASNGAYSIAAVPAGLHSVTATLVGYDSQSSAVFSVAAGTQTSLSALTLQRSSGGLVGSVALAGQSDHGGVLLEVVGTAFSTTSNSTGAYTLQNVPVGTYEIKASRTGFVSTSASSVTVVANATSAVAALTLAANPGRIMGRILKEGATDHAGILVTVNGTSYTGSSAADGSFEILGMPGGVYSVSASAAGFARYDFPLVVVSAGQSTAVGDGQLQRVKGPIHGVVTLQGRTVHSAVLVELLGSIFFTTSAADGSFELNVPTGNYAGLRFSMPQFASVSLTQTITVTENGVANLAPVQLAAVSNDVRGSVTLYGRPQHDGVQVKLTGLVGQSTQGLTFTTSSLADGSFALSAVSLGSYDVTYSYAAGWGTLVRSVSVVPGTVIQLPSEQVRETYVYINGDAPFTTTQSVSLSLNYSDCYQMRVGNIADVSDGTWQACAATRAWTLTASDGTKTVYAKFRDGNLVESPIVGDTILMKSSATITSVSHDAAGPLGRGDGIHLKLSTAADTLGSATLDIAGYDTAVELYDDASHGDATANDGVYELDYQAFKSIDVNNAVVTGHFTDRYGNVAATVNASSTITVSIPPMVSAIQVVPDLATGNATISWTTDEPAQATLQWGPTQFYGTTQSSTLLLTSESFVVGAGGLTPSTEYHYRITATDAAGNVTVTNDRSFFMQPNPPSMVIAMPGDGRFDVRWEAPPQDNIVGYNIYRSLTAGGPYTKLSGATPYTHPALFYSDLSVVNGTTYRYVVSAVDEFGHESDKSTEVAGVPELNNGPTYVHGALAGTTVWSSKGSPYIVTGNIAVEPGGLLVVGPGTSVRFDGYYFLRVDGQLVAIGTSGDSTSFTSNSSSSTGGYWSGVQLRSGSARGDLDLDRGAYRSGHVLYQTLLERSRQGISIEGGSLAMIATIVRGNQATTGYHQNPGVSARDTRLLLLDVAVRDNTVPAGGTTDGMLWVRGGRVLARGLVVEDNQAASGALGATFEEDSQVVLEDCLISGNRVVRDPLGGGGPVGGLYLHNLWPRRPVVRRCQIVGNGGQAYVPNAQNSWPDVGGVYCAGCGGAIITDTVISGNAGNFVGGLRSDSQIYVSNSEIVNNDALVKVGGFVDMGPSEYVSVVVRGNETLDQDYYFPEYRFDASQQLVTNGNVIASSVESGGGGPAVVLGQGGNLKWTHIYDLNDGMAPVRISEYLFLTSQVSWCSFPSSNSTDVLLDNATLSDYRDHDARSNYWGSAATAEMDAKGPGANVSAIYDYNDNVELSKVDYSGWVHSAYPLARIASPSWGLSFAAGEAISLSGSADDLEDGDIPSTDLHWSSEIDGPLGTGSSLNVSTLSIGPHRIWLTGTDSNGQEGKVYTEIEILAP